MTEYTTWKRDNPLCGGCGKPFPEESLTWMPTWNFHACPPCVILCNQADAEETGCAAAEITPPTCNDFSCSWCDPFGCIKAPAIERKPVQSEVPAIERKEIA